MKYGLEMQKLQKEYEAKGKAKGKAEGKAEGKMIQSLELAQEMLETNDDLEYISKIYKLPIEYVQALNDGCTVEAIMEQYFEYE